MLKLALVFSAYDVFSLSMFDSVYATLLFTLP